MTYKLRLSNFEGPLDLLLHLIKLNEVDIYDIPIATIANQYVEYLEMMQELDLEVASEFLLMAATLMEIKSRMLLPSEPLEDEAEEDPRFELIEQILEYKKFKELAGHLEDRADKEKELFQRSFKEDIDVETGEGATEALALAQDDQPGQPALERFEGDPFEQRHLTGDRPPPLLIVIVAQQTGAGPAAAGTAVVADDKAHPAPGPAPVTPALAVSNSARRASSSAPSRSSTQSTSLVL